jgi:hypothetical protein
MAKNHGTKPADWYVARQGQRYGPFTPKQLRQLVADGWLQPEHLLWQEGLPQWVPARASRGLFPAAKVPVAVALDEPVPEESTAPALAAPAGIPLYPIAGAVVALLVGTVGLALSLQAGATGRAAVPVEAAWLFAAGFLITLILTALGRVANGATLDELWRSRFYEVAPARGLIHTVHGALWIFTALLGWAALSRGHAWLNHKDARQLPFALLALLGAACLGGLAWACYRFLVRIDENDPPRVGVEDVELRHGISRGRLSRLGQERFPNTLAEGWLTEVYVRGVLAGACFLLFALLVYGSTEGARDQAWRRIGWQALTDLTTWLQLLRPGQGLFVAVAAGLGLLALHLTNKTYTLLRFARTLLGVPVLVAALLLGSASVARKPEAVATALAAAACLCGGRWAWDVWRSLKYQRLKKVYDEIAEAVREALPDLDGLVGRDDCALRPLNPTVLAHRLSQGCRNVEEVDPLVTRNFARFMTLVRVEYEHFVAGMLRYLTVRRFVTESAGAGTTRSLQSPSVEQYMWDERLFPVRPPQGYVDWLDPLALGSEWDRVSLHGPCGGTGRVRCGSCGGAGSVRVTETETYFSNGQSQTRNREVVRTCQGCCGSGETTCLPCGGHGRMVYSRTLNTQWQRLLPAVVAPEVPMPGLLEDAEERVYYRLPLVENRTALNVPAVTDGIDADLEDELAQAARALARQHRRHAGLVEAVHDGVIYRADFQVTGFWTLCIDFLRLRGKVGWFFGARPEFYFPLLPLSWGKLGTALFLPPLVALLGILIRHTLFVE